MDAEIKYIAPDRLTSVLDRLSAALEIRVPAAADNKERVVRFRPYRTGMTPVLDRQSSLGPKAVMLPQVEALLHFRYEKAADDPTTKTIHLQDPEPAKPVLIFGARPCDARGFLVFDRVFATGPFVDNLYAARRERVVIATLVCQDDDAACFCSSVGSGPADMDGSDIRLTPSGGGYLVEALTDRARPVVEALEVRATQVQVAAARKIQDETALRRVGDTDLEHGREGFAERFGALDYWRDMAGQCLSCGICTFVCPTCYCFTITDEMKETQGERIRSWDSCMFPTYTLEASGHNPRPTGLERYRNRIGHKFSYFPEKYAGMLACCGCGRCIRNCPVSMDIRKVVEHLKENNHACA